LGKAIEERRRKPMKPRPKGNINAKPSYPRPSEPPKPCPNCSTAYAQGYKMGFADAVNQYGIDKRVSK
jgi:hypothetical protein